MAPRRLAAIMFTDLVNSTAAAQADESSALALGREHDALLRPLFEAHQGRVIKSMGDGFLAEFDSALRAVECAVDIQARLRVRNSVPGVAPIDLRIGIHLGDVEPRGSDIVGDAVNLTSRIEPLAAPGGICISGEVFRQVRNKIPNRIDRLPTVALKGVKFPFEVYRIALSGEPPRPSPDPDGPPRMAVLPFANISPDPSDEYFADGLTEELIGTLSKLRDLRVIARTSVAQYKATPKSAAQIGAELGVASLLEGSVRKAGRRLRIAVQLVSVSTEEPVWAETYDRELDDVFAIQTEVASRVASSLSRSVLGPLPTKETASVEGYLYYLRAVQLLHEDDVPRLRESVALFERAISEDPAFARAYVGLARACDALVMRGGAEYTDVTTKAEPAARRALELAPDSAEGHAALAEIHGMLDRTEEGIVEAQRAIDLNPNLAEAYETLGRQLVNVHGLEASLQSFRKGFELDPLGLRAALLYAWFAQLAGHEAEAWAVIDRMHRLNPTNASVSDAVGEYYRLKGDLSKAREAFERGLRESPEDEALRVDMAVLFALDGDRKEAERRLAEIGESAQGAGQLNAQLFVRSALGDLDRAFEALRRLEEMHAWPSVVGVHPTFERLRNDARFQAFRARLHLAT
ncbi:MAG: hypothetical protein L3K23_03895 [Thermoplasmata archaeon]|nr:hypothetical protein [Thermoplasmata archaeon]